MFKKIITLALLTLSLGLVACKQTEYIHVGPNWAALDKLDPGKGAVTVQVRTADRYKIGAPLNLSVTSAADGRLWVLQVDAQDEPTLLYPNAYSPNNAISAGKPFQIPPQGANWSLEATEPAGKTLVAFIVTTGDLDLEDVLGARKEVSKALRLVETSAAWGLAKRVVDVAGPQP